jgi:hypothetical protein
MGLLLRCARWPRRVEDCEAIREQASRPIDWQHFLQLTRHHRLVPIVCHQLNGCAAESWSLEHVTVLVELRRLSAANTCQALRSLAELRRILQEFQTQGIASVRVLKGLPLAQSVFGDVGLRATGDIDLLIDEGSLLEADRALRGFGYCGLFEPTRFSPKRLDFYRAHWKDIAYRNPATGFEVDLHWCCFRNGAMPGNALCATAVRDSMTFGDLRVATLPRLESLLYLCVHGTLDGWLYLKSLVDVIAQVRTMSEAELDALATLGAGYGVLPELTAALVLARGYLGMDHWSACLLPEHDPTVRHILRYADRNLVQGRFLAGRDAIPIAATLAFEFGLRSSFRYRWELLLRVLFRARMWKTMPLPDFLFWLYPLLSPLEWLVYRLRGSRAAPKAHVDSSIQAAPLN